MLFLRFLNVIYINVLTICAYHGNVQIIEVNNELLNRFYIRGKN